MATVSESPREVTITLSESEAALLQGLLGRTFGEGLHDLYNALDALQLRGLDEELLDAFGKITARSEYDKL